MVVLYSADTQLRDDIASMSMLCDDVASTLMRRYVNGTFFVPKGNLFRFYLQYQRQN